jgi:hypothetical protein
MQLIKSHNTVINAHFLRSGPGHSLHIGAAHFGNDVVDTAFSG